MAAAAKRRRTEESRQRIIDIAGTGGVADRALVTIVARLREQPELLDDLSSTTAITRSVQEWMQELSQSHTLTLSTKDRRGQNLEFEWQFVSAAKVLKYFVKEIPCFAELLISKLRVTPNRFDAPWHLVFYCDEVVPGNPMKTENERKVHAFYFSFRELGRAALSREDAWIPVALLRTSVCVDVMGCLSGAARALLNDLFSGPDGLSTTGVVLPFDGSPVVFFAELGNVLGDESALKYTWDCKGAGGNVPCFVCPNVTTVKCELVDYLRSGDVVCISCSDPARFQVATDDDVWRKFDRLEESHGVLNKTRFEELEIASGQNYCPSGILADRALRPFVKPASVHTLDSMHCSVAHGIVQVEVFLLLKSAKANLGAKYSHIRTFTNLAWRFPRSSRVGNITRLVDEAHEAASDETFKAEASQMIQFLPVLEHFVDRVLMKHEDREKMRGEFASFKALCRVMKLLREVKFMGVTADRRCRLEAALSEHLRIFVTTYGEDSVKPKHHYMLHLPLQIARDGILLDCFVQERKHKIIKQSAKNIYFTADFERSVLARALLEQVRSLKRNPRTFLDGLLGATKPFPEIARDLGIVGAEIAIALDLRWGAMPIGVGDVLFLNDRVALVDACLLVDREVCLLVRLCDFLQEVSETASLWKLRERLSLVDLQFWPAWAVRQAMAWIFEADKRLLVVT